VYSVAVAERLARLNDQLAKLFQSDTLKIPDACNFAVSFG